MYALKRTLTWMVVLGPTWMYVPLWLIAPYTPWSYFGLGVYTVVYVIQQCVAFLFAKQSKYI